jgi:cytochrome c2
MRPSRVLLLAALIISPAVPALAWAAEPPKPFSLCIACHTGEPDALGPDLHGVVGRKAGSVEGFRYSGPMRRSNIVWTPETLQRYLQDPQSVVPGTRMPIDGLSSADAATVVTYLATLKPPPGGR